MDDEVYSLIFSVVLGDFDSYRKCLESLDYVGGMAALTCCVGKMLTEFF